MVKNHKLISIVIIAATVAAAALFYFKLFAQDDKNYTPVKRGSIIESVYGIGTVTSWHSFQLKVGVTSSIQKLFVREGDRVKKGQQLVLLDGLRPFYAPFSGIITSAPFKTGETVFSQVAILTIADFEDRYLVVSLEQQGAIRVNIDQEVQLSFESLRDKSFAGKVKAVYSSGDKFLVRIEAPNLPLSILPGMTADVSIKINIHENALLVPIGAINLGKVRVRKGENGAVTETSVQTGVIDSQMAEIVSGDIKEGDFVVMKKE